MMTHRRNPTSHITSCLKNDWMLISLLVLSALGLRLFNITTSSFWIDEIYSLIVANTHLFPETIAPTIHPARYFYEQYLAWQPMDWGRLIALLKINVHMPLYYLLVNPWMGIFGNNEYGLRSFSAVCSSLLIVPVYWLGKALGGKKAGIFSALGAMLAPFQIYYGQEGRMYALSLFWAAMAGLGFWKVLYSERPGRWAIPYALSVTGGMLTHYMFVFFLGFQAIFGLLWFIRHRDTKRFAMLATAVLALGLVGIWWFPIYQLQQQGINEEYHFAKGLVDWTRYLSLPFWQALIVVAGDNRLERVFYFPLTIVLLMLYSLKLYLQRKQPQTVASNPEKQTLNTDDSLFRREGYLLSWVFIPTLLQIAYDFWKETHIAVIDRYAMLIAPAMCLLLGLGLASLSNLPGRFPRSLRIFAYPKAIVALMAVFAVLNVWAPSPFRDEHNKDNNIRDKVRYMVKRAEPHDLVFVNGPFGAPNSAAYYLNRFRPDQPMVYWISHYENQIIPLPSPDIFIPYKRVWLFRDRANNERGLQTAKDFIQARYPHVSKPLDWWFFYRQ